MFKSLKNRQSLGVDQQKINSFRYPLVVLSSLPRFGLPDLRPRKGHRLDTRRIQKFISIMIN